jgi:hypothetical protein
MFAVTLRRRGALPFENAGEDGTREGTRGMLRSVTIDGKRFDLIVQEEPQRDRWRWIVTAPGELTLSGEAPSEMQALRSACRAGRTLAHRVA